MIIHNTTDFFSGDIVSITDCPHGVRNLNTGELISREHSTIIETKNISHVITKEVSVRSDGSVRVEDKFIHDDSDPSKKSDFRPHKRELGDSTLTIYRHAIKNISYSTTGVIDTITGHEYTSEKSAVLSVVRTTTKTYVVAADLSNYSENSKHIDIHITDILASKATKKSDFKSRK